MRLRWTEPATRDLTQICEYLEQHSTSTTARRIALAIHDTVSTLADFPELGRVGRKPNTRELVLPRLPYRAIYRVRSDSVEILRILHGAQKWP